MNPQECVWETRYRIIMKTILQEKVKIHYSTTNLVHKFIPMPQAVKIPAAKAAVDKEWEKLEKISAWNLTKVNSKKQVIDEARTKGAKVHSFCLTDGHLSFERRLNWRQSTQKYKGRVVLRGVIVKYDSGSYAVFTEQGFISITNDSSKRSWISSPDCQDAHGQAADALSAYTQVKMQDAHTIY